MIFIQHLDTTSKDRKMTLSTYFKDCLMVKRRERNDKLKKGFTKERVKVCIMNEIQLVTYFLEWIGSKNHILTTIS